MARIIYAVAGEGFGHSSRSHLTGQRLINARYIQERGLGISAEKLDEGTIARFLDELDKPVPRDERIIWPDNDRFFDILQAELNRLDTPVSLEL
ncbi:MAG: hypothetical protein GQ528_03315 [Woeseiaceae bacterium]|jgi:hypothetical protein|nr:hypothetical protein [Woeseiaceae bacterium]